MAKNKKSFILYADLIEVIEKLPDEIAGKLFKIILQYVNDKNPVVEDLLLQVAFEPIKSQLKRDLITWEDTRVKRSEAGKASANKRQQKPTRVKSVKQNSTNPTDNVTVTVNDTVTAIVTVTEIFEKFRQKFGGKKRGNGTELENFQKHEDWETVLPLLEIAVDNQILEREAKKAKNEFVAEWKNMSTWINQRCWEEETGIALQPHPKEPKVKEVDFDEFYGRK
jgi:hypothetical protein